MDDRALRLECVRIALTRGGYVLTDEVGKKALMQATDTIYAIVTKGEESPEAESEPEASAPAEPETETEMTAAAPAAAAPDKPEPPAPVQARKSGR